MATYKNIDAIMSILREKKAYLRETYKIKEIGVFGSYVRGEQGRDSDIDILIEKDEAIGLLKLANLQNYLTEIIGVHVDLVPEKSLRSDIKENVRQEVLYA